MLAVLQDIHTALQLPHPYPADTTCAGRAGPLPRLSHTLPLAAHHRAAPRTPYHHRAPRNAAPLRMANLCLCTLHSLRTRHTQKRALYFTFSATELGPGLRLDDGAASVASPAVLALLPAAAPTPCHPSQLGCRATYCPLQHPYCHANLPEKPSGRGKGWAGRQGLGRGGPSLPTTTGWATSLSY